MVRTLLNIQLLFYGMTYLMILEKNANFNQFKNILLSWNGNECKCNACKKFNIIKVFSIFILFIFIDFLAV
jgi:hypothetical protein